MVPGNVAPTTDATTLGPTVRALSDRIVDAQRPIRVLDAVKWDDEIRARFFEQGCRCQPDVDGDYYRRRPLGFAIADKRDEFAILARDIAASLGTEPVGHLMLNICDEYTRTLDMLEHRGTPQFVNRSQELYGAASDTMPGSTTTLAAFGATLAGLLERISSNPAVAATERTITGAETVTILQERISAAFPDAPEAITVKLSDGIVADAAAGADYLKIRAEARFNRQDLHLLEMHEGWVHICTTINGRLQPYCTFLAKGPPSSTVTQEGLAILIELIAFASYPERVRRVGNRIRTIAMAEDGATFLDVFRFLQSQGLSEAECYATAARTFRGSVPEGGPFTKDLSYSRGFFLAYNFVLHAVRTGLVDRVPMLFVGKTMLPEMRTVAALVESGLVVPPRHLPPPIANLPALTAWMCYSSLLRSFPVEEIEKSYGEMF